MNQEYLKSILHYDQSTGLFTWRERDDVQKEWNTRHSGRQAGRRNKGYVYIRINGKSYAAHRLAFLYMCGAIPEIVDHINMIRHDNSWSNLRASNNVDNGRRKAKPRNNTSGHVGVRRTKSGRWKVAICRKHIGYFDDLDSAIKARKKAEDDFGFHENHGSGATLYARSGR